MSCNWSTIRVGFLAMILVASLAGVPAFAQGAAAVRVEPSASSVQVNNTANIAIKVDNISNLIAFELHLSFNPSVLEVTSLANGGFVAADFEAQKTFDNAAGTIDYAIAQMNRAPAQGSGTLLNISIRAKASGTSIVTTRATPAAPNGLILSDANGMAIQASWAPGTINVGTSTSVTNTPTSTSTSSSVTNTPTNTSAPTATSTVTPCEDDDSCPPTYSSTPTNTPTHTQTSTPITNTPTNTSTPTNTPAYTPTPITPPPPHLLGTHVVRWGEWVYCIARAYRVSPWAIIQANHLWWPYIIFPNQKLTIPNVPWTNMTNGPVCQAQFTIPVPTPSPTPTTVTPPVTPILPTMTPSPATTALPSACRAIYVVRSGDTLYRIALRYGTTYTEIARVNGISNPRLIYPGQQLCIP